MNLLEKFNAVTVDVTAKVSEADNKICRSLQKRMILHAFR